MRTRAVVRSTNRNVVVPRVGEGNTAANSATAGGAGGTASGLGCTTRPIEPFAEDSPPFTQ
jgi:hypothetical protein